MVPTANPHNARVPDFDLIRYRAARQPLVDDFTVTHEQAAQRLAAMWQAQNVIDREEWDNQQDELAEAARLQQEERQQEEEELQRTLDEEKELAKQEERKKNRNKFLPYNKVPVSSTITRLPLPLAIRKLKKGDYVELYYFTNKGLADAEASTRSADDDALALTRDEDGHHAFIPATAAKTKETVVPDKDLTWTEFDEAAPRILQSMRENGWEEEHIQSHLNMWMKLSAHPFRHDPDEYGKRALIVYQDTVRRRWHNLLGTPQSFDLIPINTDMIKEIRDDILHKSNKALREESLQASTIPVSLLDFVSSLHPIPTLPFSTFQSASRQPNASDRPFLWLHLYRSRFRFTANNSRASAPRHPPPLPHGLNATPHNFPPCVRTRYRQTNNSASARPLHSSVLNPPVTVRVLVPTPNHLLHLAHHTNGSPVVRSNDRVPRHQTPQNVPTNVPNPFAPLTHPAAQTKPFPRVPSASDVRPTPCRSSTAPRKKPGTTNTTPMPNVSNVSSMPNSTEYKSVPPGNAPRAVQTNTLQPTYAPAADLPSTELTRALEHRRKHPQTPYKPDAWETALRRADLLERFSSIPDGLRYGFRVDFPNITRVQSPLNSPSSNVYHTELHEIIQKEVTKGRYIGPFPLVTIISTIGPYQSSPLSIVPKPGRTGKFRLVQNFSFPLSPTPSNPQPSINSYVTASNFPATWGKFSIVFHLASKLPPDSEVATRDVAEAYRTIPLHPSQWPAAVVRTSPTHGCIDTCTAFGATPSAGSYGHLADAAAEIFRHRGIGPLDKWVDDHIFFRIRTTHLPEYNQMRAECHNQITQQGMLQAGSRLWFTGATNEDGSTQEFNENCAHPIASLSHVSPRSHHDSLFTYNLADIDAVSAELGIPWEISKDQPFGPSTTYIGFRWHLDERRVELTPEKRDKYLRAIDEWDQRYKHCLGDVSKLYGKLLHTSSLIPEGRAYLTGFERMLAVCAHKPFLPHRPDKAIAGDLNWWKRMLSANKASRPITLPRSLFLNPQAFSDASSGIGVAIVIGDWWRAWRLIPGWQTHSGLNRDIAWAEAIGFEFLLATLSSLLEQPRHVIAYGDNTSVIESWRVGRHRNKAVNDVFKRIHALVGSDAPRIRSVLPVFTPSACNPADGPSRGIYGPLNLLLPRFPIPPYLAQSIVDFSDPITPAEALALRNGLYSAPAAKCINRLKREQELSEFISADQRELDVILQHAAAPHF